jgi:hypothetical protein
LFSNELARRYHEEGIVSISLYPGTMNAGFSGANSVTTLLTQIKQLFVACCWFMLSCGDLTFLVEDARFLDEDGDTFNIERLPERGTNGPEGNRYSLEHSGASYRAITSLYAGTAPDAGHLNGKVRYPASRLIALGTPTYWICNNISLYSISPHGHASHFRIRKRSTWTLGQSCGTGANGRSEMPVKSRSKRENPSKRKNRPKRKSRSKRKSRPRVKTSRPRSD